MVFCLRERPPGRTEDDGPRVSDLVVLVDGVPLPGDEARAFWRRFSEWMNEHAGDLAGFAKVENLASVRPELHDGSPVLVASRTAAQTPYAPAPKKKTPTQGGGGGGSAGPSNRARKTRQNESSRPKSPDRASRDRRSRGRR
jgi:hypothetical protein